MRRLRSPLAFEPGEAFQFDWSEDWASGPARLATANTQPFRSEPLTGRVRMALAAS